MLPPTEESKRTDAELAKLRKGTISRQAEKIRELTKLSASWEAVYKQNVRLTAVYEQDIRDLRDTKKDAIAKIDSLTKERDQYFADLLRTETSRNELLVELNEARTKIALLEVKINRLTDVYNPDSPSEDDTSGSEEF